MTKVLITGISGFAGSHLAEYLLTLGTYEITGTYLDDKILPIMGNVQLEKINLLDKNLVNDLVERVDPDLIFHLAALTSPKDSFNNPTETFLNNVSAQINILESIKNNSSVKILIVSSAEVYGIVDKKDLPIDEETKFNPSNPYAVSKLTQDFLGLQYFNSYKTNLVRVRPFNHIGPRQSPLFVVSSFAKRIVEIEKGKEKALLVGNLSSKRDFTDVRDMVKAYELAITKGESGDVYNLGRGQAYSIAEILEKLISMSNKKIEVVTDEKLIRPKDNPELLCDTSKFEKLTGWIAEIEIEKTLKDTLDYWRGEV